MSPYQMEINNAARYILDNNPDKPNTEPISIFQFAAVLGVCHCKSNVEVAQDILNAQNAIIAEEGGKKPLESFFAKKMIEKNIVNKDDYDKPPVKQ